ncbi:glycosyltransferase [Actinomycetospora callitridis]|uniref:glycosyltransferase n=1 Tax=Actinomycetospora callitridis TaxID=913944 RepID=UPI0023673835|nr:glycosyltransferase [Actinomycetospora callitridis]MDD7917650.1 glycosyltransferase [Actinomycetospora callitridis]
MRRWTPTLGGLSRTDAPLNVRAASWVLGDHNPRHEFHVKFIRRSGTLDRLIRQSDPQLVHAHFGFDATLICPFVARERIPLVVTFHGYDVTSLPYESSLAAVSYRRRIGELFRYSSRLIAVSDFVAEKLVALGAPPEKIAIRHIGVPSGLSSAPASHRRGVLFVGRLVEKKGLADLLMAVSRLPDSFHSVEVNIVGDGPLRAQMEVLAARLGVNATFHGSQDSAGVSRAMSEAAVFCAPSRTARSGDSEGFGLVFLEAALHQLPVVSYAHGGVRSAVANGETGILVEEGDIRALSEALHRLLTDPETRSTLGVAGARRVVREFEVQAQTQALESLYDETVEANA